MKTVGYTAWLLIFGSYHLCSANIVNDLYAKIFGAQDASAWYQEQTRNALRDYGIEQPERVPIKQMNSVGSSFIGEGLYSFSMFNIWYNEALLDQFDENERLFIIYHEAAHIALKHHQTLLLYLLPTPLLIKVIPYLNHQLFSDQSAYARYATLAIEWLISALAIDRWVVRPLVLSQEKAADLHAAQILLQTGHQDILYAYMQALGRLIDAGYADSSDGWHPTIAEQYAYLQTCMPPKNVIED